MDDSPVPTSTEPRASYLPPRQRRSTAISGATEPPENRAQQQRTAVIGEASSGCRRGQTAREHGENGARYRCTRHVARTETLARALDPALAARVGQGRRSCPRPDAHAGPVGGPGTCPRPSSRARLAVTGRAQTEDEPRQRVKGEGGTWCCVRREGAARAVCVRARARARVCVGPLMSSTGASGALPLSLTS